MDNLIGLTIANRYRLESVIWKSGKSEIYKAWDLKRSTHFALKLLRFNSDDDNIYINHMLMEARILADLMHPNIIRFYELGQYGEFVFIVLEYINGITLKKWNELGRIQSFDDVLRVAQPICLALHYLHTRGVVHADIKPNNILIGINNYKVCIIDFGIAHLIGSVSDERGNGTPLYMAPEQVLGDFPSPQSDIYSLGVVLYEIVSGEAPFNGGEASIDGVLSEKIKWEKINLLPPLFKKTKFRVPSNFKYTINKALSPEPDDRQLSALEFWDSVADSGLFQA